MGIKKFVIFFLVAYAYIFCVLLNYENAWMHPEVANTTKKLLSEHASLQDRLLQIFNWPLIEGDYEGKLDSRPRIFSHLVQVINILFRNWLFHYIPPHPSFSLTWIVALGITPYFLYRLIFNLIEDEKAALLTALVYLCLPGTLIPVMMLFHPAKVFANFWYIFCLYLGSKINRNLNTKKNENFKKGFLILVLMICVSLFFDEYCLFIFLLIPLFYPGIFSGPSRFFVCSLYVGIPIFYFVTTVFFLPKFYAFIGYPGFNILHYVGLDRHLPTINLQHSFINFILMLHDNLSAGFNAYLKPGTSVFLTRFLSVNSQLIGVENIIIAPSFLYDKHVTAIAILHNLLTIFIGALFVMLVIKRKLTIKGGNSKAGNYFLKSLLALVLYSIFFTFLHHVNNILSGCGWYGCCFSIFFAMTIGLMIKLILENISWSKLIVPAFIFTLLFQSLENTKLLNKAWMVLHYRENYWELDMWLNKKTRYEIYQMHSSVKGKGNFRSAYQTWKYRKDPVLRKLILDDAPREVRSYLVAELPHV